MLYIARPSHLHGVLLAAAVTVSSSLALTATAHAQEEPAAASEEMPPLTDTAEPEQAPADDAAPAQDVSGADSARAEPEAAETASETQPGEPVAATQPVNESVAAEPAPAKDATAPQPAPAVEKAAAGAGKTSTTTDENGVMLDHRNVDYYDKRAAEILKADEGQAAVTEHPLASAYPNQFIVVCEAGCNDGTSAQIVSMIPRPATVAPAPEAKPAPVGAISCVGGCPDGVRGTYIAMPGPASGGAALAANVGEWMTTVAQSASGSATPRGVAASGSGSGDWMKQINADRKPEGAEPAEVKTAAKTPEAPPAKSPQPVSQSADAPPAGEVKPATATPATVEAKPAPAIETAKQEPAQELAKAPATAVVETAKQAPAPGPALADAAPQSATVGELKTTAGTMSAEADATQPAAPVTAEAPPVQPANEPAEFETTVQPAAETKAEAQPQAQAAAAPVAEGPAPGAAEANPAADAKPVEQKMAALEQPTPASEQKKVISVLSEDKDMNAAIAKARGSLEQFWASYSAPGANEGDFALKVAISGNGATEHFWLTRIKRDGDKLSGVISNDPQTVKSVTLGQTYAFSEDMISDWTFKRNGKLVGNETMRVLLPRMPADQAAAYRAMYETP